MKNYILFLVFISIGIQQGLYSQCVNEVNTRYDHVPSQKHLDVLPSFNNQPDERFLNGWKWWFDGGINANNSIPLNNMGQSSGSFYGSSMKHFNDDSQLPYYSYLSFDFQEVMLPENGWELLADNRGWYPSNDIEIPMNHSAGEWTSSENLRKIPYLLFYNKFTGVARIFARYGNNSSPIGSINAAEISLYHINEDNMSGLLRLGDGLDRSLEQKSLIKRISATVPSPGDENKWFSCDFQLAYDPCICDYESQIEAEFRFINEGEIFLHGAGFSTPVNLLEDQNLLDQDFLNTYNNSDGVNNGYMIYKSMEGMVEDYYIKLKEYQDELALVGEHNKKVDANVAILTIAKTVFNVASGGGVSAVSSISNYGQLISLIPGLSNISDNGVFGEHTQKEYWKQLDKALGMGFDFYIKENFTKKEDPQKPSMPTATATEMKFSGEIIHSTPPFTSSTINTPGSKSANTNGINLNQPQRYPIYNEVLGVFAILDRPKVKVYESMENIDCSYAENEEGRFAAELRFDHVFQFSINEDLKYYFNQVLSIEEYDIKASFEIHSSRKPGTQINSINGSPWEIRNNHSKAINVESTSYSIDEPMALVPNNIVVNSLFVPIDALNHFTGEYATHYIFGKTGVGSGEEMCEQLESTKLDVFPHLGIDSLYLKLLVNVTYEGEKSDGSPHEYTYMFTYKVEPEDIERENTTPLHPNLPGSIGDLSEYPENLYFDEVEFNGAQIDGCQLNGATYNCKAWNDITLSGDFTVSNGYNVIIEAGNEVLMEPEANTPPEMIWQIIPVLNYSDPMPPASSDYVSNFCSDDTRYKARSSSMPTINSGSIFDNEEDLRDFFAFNIFPNPTSGDVTATISLDKEADGQLYITDMNGRVLKTAFSDQILREGESRYQLSTASLSKGLYLVHLIVDGERHVKRLVKQ